MEKNNIIKFNNLSKRYGNYVGIENLDLSIQRGEIFGFLGPNGAGKTTTIRLMLDLLKPSDGSVQIFGKDVHTHSFEIRKEIGYLPGNFSPYEKMTGKDYLKFVSGFREKKGALRKDLFSLFELSKNDLDKKIRAYSQGMKQKLGIIQAVAHSPELIILDEPSTGLDPLMQDTLYELLFKLNEEGSTIFFSSHNLPEVEKICEKVAIVKDGHLVGHEALTSLRKKLQKIMKIIFSKDILSIPEIPGTQYLKEQNGRHEYLMNSDVMKILPHLQNLPIIDISISEPSLEDIFISYYKSKANSDVTN